MNLLHKKLLIKENQRILLLNAPANIDEIIGDLSPGITVSTGVTAQFDLTIAFVVNGAELQVTVNDLLPFNNNHTILWICYPKKSSGIKSDLTMSSWDVKEHGLSGVAAISVDKTWTAIRLKPSSQVKKSGLGNAEITNNELGRYIDVLNKIIILPPDFQDALNDEPEAMVFFNTLSYSNRKEYVSWILTAKQDKTRLDRIAKSVVKLRAKKKNPAA